jgi:hypothetical protein
MDERTFSRLLTLAAPALAVVIALRAQGLGDYPTDAGPALTAIAHGSLSGFFAHQPAMGPLSLWLRAPAVMLAAALHDGVIGSYRWGCLVCVLAVAAVAVWMARIAARRGAGPAAILLIIAICLLNPLVGDAIYWGHPEELLTASLAVAALLAACDGRPLLTGVLAGLAVAGKQWAILVLVPALLIIERRRIRAVTAALVASAGMWLPMLVANAGAFMHAVRYIASPQPVVTFFTWLYPFSPAATVRVANIFGDARRFEAHRVVGLEAAARPLITLLGVAIPVIVWWRRGRRAGAAEILTAAAIVFVLRCALDPGSAGYYHFPLLLILLALDVEAGRRLPVAALAGCAAAFVVLDRLAAYLSAGLANGAYIAATVAGCAMLVAELRGSAAARAASGSAGAPRLGPAAPAPHT